MAYAINYADSGPHKQKLHIRINRRGNPVEAVGYEGLYFKEDDLPDGKRQYYCRHSDFNCNRIAAVKKTRGFTVNFWGTIVTDKPIDFGGKEEILISAKVADD